VKKLAIVQSNYIPWKGYFDVIANVDEFVLFDDVQYTKRDWRNRNKIKTSNGSKWLTVPVKVKGKYYQNICDTRIDGVNWAQKHWMSLSQNYRKAPYFKEIATWLEPLYTSTSYTLLSDLNFTFMKQICDYLGISTLITRLATTSTPSHTVAKLKTERLIDLCKETNSTEYITGPAAKGYIDEKLFIDNGITLTWYDYSGYPEYQQLWGDFEHQVTILDLLFNCGKDSLRYMKISKL